MNEKASWWKALCCFAPVTLFLKTYSFAIMCFDCSYFLFFTCWAIFQSILGLIKKPELKSVSAEICVIVGSSRGVGKEISFQLSELGATVVCVDINKTGNDETVKQIKSQYGSAVYGFTCDVTIKSEVSRIVDLIEEEIGKISMLFHCCGVPSPRSLVTEALPIQKTLEVSVISHFWLLDKILPKFKKECRGHIIFLTSVAGLSKVNQLPLSVAQFATQGLFESLAEELRLDRYHNVIHLTIAHIYPFIISKDLVHDIRLRIPSYFGTISSTSAATQIINGVRRNYMEISVPGYLLYCGHILKLLPRRAIFLMRELLDTGVDFG